MLTDLRRALRRNALPGALSLTALALCLAPAVHAKLAPVSLDEMIARSEVIYPALPSWTQRGEPQRQRGKGRAELVPFGPELKGKPPASVRIAWSEEVHDQAIPDLDLRVLFLARKKSGGGYEAAVYGRSYLRVAHASVRTASLPEILQKNAVHDAAKDMEHVEVVFVDAYPETTIKWPEPLVMEVDVYRPHGGEDARFEKRKVVLVDALYVYVKTRSSGD